MGGVIVDFEGFVGVDKERRHVYIYDRRDGLYGRVRLSLRIKKNLNVESEMKMKNTSFN